MNFSGDHCGCHTHWSSFRVSEKTHEPDRGGCRVSMLVTGKECKGAEDDDESLDGK